MSPGEVVRQWLAGWADADREALKRLLPHASVVHADEPAELAGDYAGFDEAERYFSEKARRVPGFQWQAAGEVTEAGPFAVLPFRLSDAAGREWWQLAVYRIDDDHIAEIWLLEQALSRRR